VDYSIDQVAPAGRVERGERSGRGPFRDLSSFGVATKLARLVWAGRHSAVLGWQGGVKKSMSSWLTRSASS
jgi:hypothetical protein